MKKSTVNEIKTRFDNDVERFSKLDIGQTSTVDAVLAMDLITKAAALVTPGASQILDIGCGAGNYTLKLLQRLPNLDVTLIDLSRPMLDRAEDRIGDVSKGARAKGKITALQGDIREIDIGEGQYDIVLAAAVLHHLRGDGEWESVFEKIFRALRSGGGFWVFDLVEDTLIPVQRLMWERYGEYLVEFRDDKFRDLTFRYIVQEDTPRSLLFQVELMRKVGFVDPVVLHKNICYAAFGAVKP